LTNPSTIRAVARRYGIRFLRRWGQNFLADRRELDRLVDALSLESGDRVIEVGAGIGTLTVEVAQRVQSLLAVEIDPAGVRALALTLRDRPNVRVLAGDILRTPVAELMTAPYRVLGNIPYNLTGALLLHLLEQTPAPARIDLLVQREVAERITAPPGAWSLATLGVRVYGEAQLLHRVPRSAFLPPPQVDSALLRIMPRAEPEIPRPDLPAFFRFVTPFFQVRRKQLPYVLARRHGVGSAEARRALDVIGIDPTRRPETLTVEEWRRLYESEHKR
jgi:16S rRNA (adenine1518-N6/adenine1519-N6)-dimethyltransferase